MRFSLRVPASAPPPSIKHSSLRRFLNWAWCAGLIAVILVSVFPVHSAPMVVLARAGLNDKVEHFTAYAVLVVFTPFRYRICATIAFLFFLGGALELAQSFSPGRSCDWHDLLANSGGLLVGTVLAIAVRQLTNR
jgi:VanZ family protein